MSFGGAVGAMITSMKNNKRERKSTFKKLENYNQPNNKLHFNKTATDEDLKKIRDKIQKRNKLILIRNIILTISISAILIYFFGFY